MRGQRVCKMHGGKAPQALAAAAVRVQRSELEGRAHRAALRLLGGELQVDPLEALLGAVREAAANVEALRELAATLGPEPEPEDLQRYRAAFRQWERGEVSRAPEPPRTLYGLNHLGDGAPHVLVTMYAEERERLVRFAKAAVDAGATERQVALAEAHGQQVANVITRLLEDPRLNLEAGAKAIGREVAAELLRSVTEAAPASLELTG